MRTFLIFASVFVAWLVSAWALTLVVGIAHLDWWSAIPTMSFGTAMSMNAVWLVAIVLGQVLKAIQEAVAS